MFRQFLEAISHIMVDQRTLLQLPKERHLNKIVLILRDVGHVVFFKSEDCGHAALQLKGSSPIYFLSSKSEAPQILPKKY